MYMFNILSFNRVMRHKGPLLIIHLFRVVVPYSTTLFRHTVLNFNKPNFVVVDIIHIFICYFS